MANGQQFYSEDEAEEILRLASNSPLEGGTSRERLLAMAAELGISEAAVLDAEDKLHRQKTETNERAEFDKYQRRQFFESLTSYVSVNLLLVGIWWFTGHRYFWPVWSIGIWGIIFVIEVIEASTASGDEKAFEKWKRKREKKENAKNTDVLAEDA